MKLFLKIVGGVIAFFIIVFVAVFYLTKDMVKVADGFFEALQQKDVELASGYLSEAFKKSTTLEQVAAYAEENGFYDYEGSSWSSRSFDGGSGEISGSITTSDGGRVPLTIQFVKEEGEWKIYHLTKPSSGIQQKEVAALTVPSETELVKLVGETTAVFAQSINEKSMNPFYEHASALWQKQTTPEQLEEAFSIFIEREYDFTILNNYSPQFKSAPTIDEDGSLNIFGMYQLKQNQVHFEQNYVYEGLSWKLFGINVNVE